MGWGGKKSNKGGEIILGKRGRGKKRKEKRGKRERAEINKERKRGENEVKVLSCGAHLKYTKVKRNQPKVLRGGGEEIQL